MRTLASRSKSFALASRLLPAKTAADAAVLYACCRRANEAIDGVAWEAQQAALSSLRAEVEQIFGAADLEDPLLLALRDVVRRRQIPQSYFDELLAGLAMDVAHRGYQTLDELLLYCHRVAGTVGLMMGHVLGVRSPRTLRSAAHLGIAMQLTNICRDVARDWENGQLYLPRSLFRCTQLPAGDFPPRLVLAAKVAVGDLLEEARKYYASGDAGLARLPWRESLALRSARLIYAAVGERLESGGCDVLAARAVVPRWQKIALLASAVPLTLAAIPRTRAAPAGPLRALRFPEDVLPL